MRRLGPTVARLHKMRRASIASLAMIDTMSSIAGRLTDMKGFGTNPGALVAKTYVPQNLAPGRGAGRRPPRLHPERRRLRPRQRLVRACRPPRLRLAVPRADAVQQSQSVLQLVPDRRPPPRAGRTRLDRADGPPHGRGARPRPVARVHQRAVGGRGDDQRHARDLSRTVRRRGDHRRPAVRSRRGRPPRARADARGRLPVAPRARQQDRSTPPTTRVRGRRCRCGMAPTTASSSPPTPA